MQNRAVDPRVSILKDISPLLTSVLDTDSVLEMIIESRSMRKGKKLLAPGK